MLGVAVLFCFPSCTAKSKKAEKLTFRTLFWLKKKPKKVVLVKTKLSLGTFFLKSPKIFIKEVWSTKATPPRELPRKKRAGWMPSGDYGSQNHVGIERSSQREWENAGEESGSLRGKMLELFHSHFQQKKTGKTARPGQSRA